MAQETRTYRVCDVCPVDVDATTTDKFTLNGYGYEIDLCAEHSAELYGAVMRFADRGTQVREPSVLDKPKVYAPRDEVPRKSVPTQVQPQERVLPLSTMEWTLSAHAEERMVERGFTRTDVLLACVEPEVVLPPLHPETNPCEQRKRGRCLLVVDPGSHRVVTVKVAGETRHTWKKESA